MALPIATQALGLAQSITLDSLGGVTNTAPQSTDLSVSRGRFLGYTYKGHPHESPSATQPPARLSSCRCLVFLGA